MRRLAFAGIAALVAAGIWFGVPRLPRPARAPGLGDVAAEGLEIATFAGGCFWCMEPPFDAIPGVKSTTSGYTGGTLPDPTYEQVSSGGTGHAESVQIEFDPRQVSYGELLEVYWKNIDPLAQDAQFCDHGSQYRTAIFYHGEAQRQLAQKYFDRLAASGRFSAPVRTALEPAGEFYAAEDYHQDYSVKNPVRYKYYRYACGRDQRLAELWGEGPARAEPLLAPEERGTETRAEPPGGAGLVAGRAEPGDDALLLRELLAQALTEEQLSGEERELLQQLIAQESALLEPESQPAQPGSGGIPVQGAPQRELSGQP